MNFASSLLAVKRIDLRRKYSGFLSRRPQPLMLCILDNARPVRVAVVRDLRRATGVQHHRRTEPSATNAAYARSLRYQRKLAVTSPSQRSVETFTRKRSTTWYASADTALGARSSSSTKPAYRCSKMGPHHSRRRQRGHIDPGRCHHLLRQACLSKRALAGLTDMRRRGCAPTPPTSTSDLPGR